MSYEKQDSRLSCVLLGSSSRQQYYLLQAAYPLASGHHESQFAYSERKELCSLDGTDVYLGGTRLYIINIGIISDVKLDCLRIPPRRLEKASDLLLRVACWCFEIVQAPTYINTTPSRSLHWAAVSHFRIDEHLLTGKGEIHHHSSSKAV